MSQEVYEKLAKKILTESLRVKKGENVTIETWNNGLPFATQTLLEVKRIGAVPVMLFEDEKTFVEAAKTIRKDHLGRMGKHEHALVSESDVYIFIPGPPIGYAHSISSELRSASTAYGDSWYDTAEKAKLRGVRLSFGYVGKGMVSLLGKKKDAIVKHLIDASLCDFSKIRKKAKRILQNMTEGARASIVSDRQRLEVHLKGDVILEDGVVDKEDIEEYRNIAYMPPGLVGKEVDPKSASGTVKISSPITKYGGFSDATLKFKNGKLTSWSSKSGKGVLDKLINSIPKEKRSVTQVGVGLNPVLKYGYSQDRFVSGAISINVGSFAFSGVNSKGTLSIGRKKIVEKGKIL